MCISYWIFQNIEYFRILNMKILEGQCLNKNRLTAPLYILLGKTSSLTPTEKIKTVYRKGAVQSNKTQLKFVLSKWESEVATNLIGLAICKCIAILWLLRCDSQYSSNPPSAFTRKLSGTMIVTISLSLVTKMHWLWLLMRYFDYVFIVWQ